MASIINATTTAGVSVAGDNSGSLQLATNNGTTAVTVTTGQLVGIGTTSPSAKLDINGGGSTAKINTLDTFDGGASLSTWMKVGRRAGTGNNSYINTSHDGSDAVDALTFAFGTSGTGTEAMRINSSGDTIIGSTTASGKLRVFQTSTSDRTITASSPASYAATAFRSDSAATASTGWYHLYGSSSGGSVNNIFIYGNGNIENANNSYGGISDIKLKENIVDATPKLEKLMQVKVRNYNFKGEYDQHKQLGVIAQELETIFPSLIEETQDRGENDELLGTTTKSVKYSVFVPMLIKALQELKATVDAQAVRIAELEGAR